MSEKRRDKKRRILREGESQRKDGRYAYKYTDSLGRQKFVYAWKLVPTDRTPTGKRDDLSLREKEEKIRSDYSHVDAQMTVCALFEKYIAYNRFQCYGTQEVRKSILKLLREDPLGKECIGSVKVSRAKDWALRMSRHGYAYRTISSYKAMLKSAFDVALEDEVIGKNPFVFKLSGLIENNTKPRPHLTPSQQQAFVDFIAKDKTYRRYLDDVIILLGTGMRISELCGITRVDVNLEERSINVDHQLLRKNNGEYYVSVPKTAAGKRTIPMSTAVYDAFVRVIGRRCVRVGFSVDGYSDFLFLNSNGLPRTKVNYGNAFVRIMQKYEKLGMPSIPRVTPHVLRHTFCSTMANAGMNPKALQYIMGHANINMTMNYYADTDYVTAAENMMLYVL